MSDHMLSIYALVAMFVVYESPIQFFAGNPSQGLKELVRPFRHHRASTL